VDPRSARGTRFSQEYAQESSDSDHSDPEESMLLYISATTQVVSAVLLVEREEPRRSQKVQRPVYFVGEVLSDSKTRYS
jgi:hypothetical protein